MSSELVPKLMQLRKTARNETALEKSILARLDALEAEFARCTAKVNIKAELSGDWKLVYHSSEWHPLRHWIHRRLRVRCKLSDELLTVQYSLFGFPVHTQTMRLGERCPDGGTMMIEGSRLVKRFPEDKRQEVWIQNGRLIVEKGEVWVLEKIDPVDQLIDRLLCVLVVLLVAYIFFK